MVAVSFCSLYNFYSFMFLFSFLGENEDPRPYSKRSPSARRDKLKKDRTVGRGVNVGLLKRRGGRGGTVLRKEKSRETSNDVCLFFVQGKCHRVRNFYFNFFVYSSILLGLQY